MSRIIQNQQNLKKQQQAALMEQRYYVLQDLDNVLGIFAETAEVIKFFEEFPDHQMVTNAQNRFIAQVNISNSIHFDQKDDHDPLLAGNLKGLKALAKEYFKELRQQIPFTDKIDQVADHYMNQNLNENNILQQLNGVKSNSTAEFNAKTLQKIIDSMNQMDTLMGNIRAGQKVDIPTKDQFLQKMKARQLNAQNQLKQNFKKEYQESLKKQELKLKQNENDDEETHVDVDEQQTSQGKIPISQPNRGIITYLNNLHKEIQCKPFNISALNQIISKMKSEMEIQDLILIFQKIQKQFNKTSEMFYLFNQILETIQKQNSQIDLTQIDRARIQESEIMKLKDYIKTLELAQQGVESQNQETTENIPQNNQHGSENDQQANIINMIFIEDLKSLLKQFNYQKFSEQSFIQIIESMKKSVQIRDLILIFQKLQTIFGRTSEMSKLFDRIIKSISDQYSRINLSGIQKSYILANEIQQLQYYIDDLEQQVKRQETQNQQQRQIEKQTQNIGQNNSENVQEIKIRNQQIIYHLRQLYTQINDQKYFNDPKYQQIIASMKNEIQIKDLIKIFEEIRNLFNENSEMFKLFDKIIKDIPQKNSKIYLSNIDRARIQVNEIRQLYIYIHNLEQGVENKQQQSIEQITQNKQNDLENEQYKNQKIIEDLKLLHSQIKQKTLSDQSLQQIIESMKKNVQTRDLILIFQEIQHLFDKNSQMFMFKLFGLIIISISDQQTKINLSGTNSLKLQTTELNQFYDYIQTIELQAKRQDSQSIEKQTQNIGQNNSENVQEIKIRNQQIIYHLSQLYTQINDYKYFNDPKYQQIIASMKNEIQIKDLILKFEEIRNLLNENSEMFKLFDKIIKDIPKKNSTIYLSNIDRARIQVNEIRQLYNYIIKLEQDQQVEENQNQGSTEKTSQNTHNRSENDQQINIQKLKIIEDLKSLLKEFQFTTFTDQYIQQIIENMKKNMEAKDLIQIFQEIQKLFDKDSHMFKLFDKIITSIQDQYTNLNLTGIYRSYIQDYEINRLSKYIRENEEWLRQQK